MKRTFIFLFSMALAQVATAEAWIPKESFVCEVVFGVNLKTKTVRTMRINSIDTEPGFLRVSRYTHQVGSMQGQEQLITDCVYKIKSVTSHHEGFAGTKYILGGTNGDEDLTIIVNSADYISHYPLPMSPEEIGRPTGIQYSTLIHYKNGSPQKKSAVCKHK